MWKEVSGTRTYFHYADEGLIGEYDANGIEIKTYGYKPGSTWTTDPLFMKIGSEYYFYHNDHLGTPQKMTAVNGAVVWSAKYDSFGKADIDASSSITNNLRFPGQYFDAETGLYYNYYRYYNPVTGQYNRTDPIGFYGGDENFYTYVKNNPIIRYDNWGLEAVEPLPPASSPWPGFREIPGGRKVPDPIPVPKTRITPIIFISLVIVAITPSNSIMTEEEEQVLIQNERKKKKNECDNNDCNDKLTDYQLKNIGIDAHGLKYEVLGRRAKISHYEVCKCKSGEIVIRLKGCKGPIIPTGYLM